MITGMFSGLFLRRDFGVNAHRLRGWRARTSGLTCTEFGVVPATGPVGQLPKSIQVQPEPVRLAGAARPRSALRLKLEHDDTVRRQPPQQGLHLAHVKRARVVLAADEHRNRQESKQSVCDPHIDLPERSGVAIRDTMIEQDLRIGVQASIELKDGLLELLSAPRHVKLAGTVLGLCCRTTCSCRKTSPPPGQAPRVHANRLGVSTRRALWANSGHRWTNAAAETRPSSLGSILWRPPP
jgi:hypothetical protein